MTPYSLVDGYIPEHYSLNIHWYPQISLLVCFLLWWEVKFYNHVEHVRLEFPILFRILNKEELTKLN
jgi:hypothetical protein